MADTKIFDSSAGPVTSTSIRESLERVGAADCEILYVHSGLSFGTPSAGVNRREILSEMLDAIRELNVPTVCMPTFTFSFCNGQDYDRRHSKSQMGALNEYFRLQPDAERSMDPLMSVALIGKDVDLVRHLGVQSTGENSTFDKINRRSGVKFLFFGVGLGDCFTYMHYLEWKAGVPYRYDRDFSGLVIDGEERERVTRKLFVRYNGVLPNDASYRYGEMLEAKQDLIATRLGDSMVSCVAREPAEQLYLELLDKDPNFFICEPFDRALVNEEFHVSNMVAL